MNIAFVLSRARDSAPLWDLIAPIKKTGDRVEFWFPGPIPESRFSVLTSDLIPGPDLIPIPDPAPDLAIYGVMDGDEPVHADADARDLHRHEGRLRWLEGIC
ncbi:MAG: hypothetical protein LBU21_09965, partial [Treponema sp.]|nr:hypothetical protein [Treponema sp.]